MSKTHRPRYVTLTEEQASMVLSAECDEKHWGNWLNLGPWASRTFYKWSDVYRYDTSIDSLAACIRVKS